MDTRSKRNNKKDSQEKNRKNIGLGCLGCFGIIIIMIFIVGIVSSFFSSSESNNSDSYQDKIKDTIGKDTSFEEKNNILIVTTDTSVSSSNIFVDIGFPQDAANVLKFVKNEKFDGYIIRAKGNFLDNKGNKSLGVTESVYFEAMNIKDINFDNWVNQVTANSTVFYDLSSAYYISNSVFDSYDGTIVKIPNKTLVNTTWNTYGREIN